jgi:hypothetical protein
MVRTGTEIFSSPERIAIAGIPFEPLTRKAFREDYLLYLRNVVRQFKLPIEHYRRVVGIENKSNYHRLRKFCSRQKTDLFDQLGVTLVNAQPVVDQSTMETNVPNVFVIGTAAAGTELGGVTTFIENTHIHVKRVLHALNLIEHVHAAPDRPIDEREI